MFYSLLTGINVDNHWAVLVKLNYELLTDENKRNATVFLSRQETHGINGYSNLFLTDGYSMESIIEITDNLYNIYKKNKDKIKIPNTIRHNEPTIFYNFTEAWIRDDYFDALEKIVEMCGIFGKVVLSNGAVNLDDLYSSYCSRNSKPKLLECHFNDGPSLFCLHNEHYSIPDETIPEASIENKRLFCSFNWNPWAHRLALIVLLNYYDLIDDGFITSPGSTKFAYDPEADFDMLVSRSGEFLYKLDDHAEILRHLHKLKPKYPLVIDDRTQYKDTDEPLENPNLKMPMLTARVNSIFEIVAETRFYGEHFFTEKTINPICLGKPLFILTSANCLKSFKKLGYKSFAPFVDESYDKIENDAERIRAITKELRRLKIMRKREPKTFYSLVDNVYQIAQYNLEHFALTGHHPKNTMFDYRKNIMRFIKLC